MTEIYGSRVILNIGIAKILGDLSRIYHREFDWSYWSKIRARHCLWLMHFWRLPMVTNRWQEWRHREEVCFITAHQWLSHQCSLIQNQHHERYVLNCPLPPYFNWLQLGPQYSLTPTACKSPMRSSVSPVMMTDAAAKIWPDQQHIWKQSSLDCRSPAAIPFHTLLCNIRVCLYH